MPELGEVEYYRKEWNPGMGKRVRDVVLHAGKRVFRDCDTAALRRGLENAVLRDSQALGKQMLFRFDFNKWLGVHLGMSGKLRTEPLDYGGGKHDHLRLCMSGVTLVFEDYRQFGRIRYDEGDDPPQWWQCLPVPISRDSLTLKKFRDILNDRSAPLKAVLLGQDHFPGIGNWMADEILWRARIHPATEAGRLGGKRLQRLHDAVLEVVDDALRVVGNDASAKPDGWLLAHRWKDGGRCPVTGKPLRREQIGGRKTCYCPAIQR